VSPGSSLLRSFESSSRRLQPTRRTVHRMPVTTGPADFAAPTSHSLTAPEIIGNSSDTPLRHGIRTHTLKYGRLACGPLAVNGLLTRDLCGHSSAAERRVEPRPSSVVAAGIYTHRRSRGGMMAKDAELDRLGAERDQARDAMDQVKRALDDAWDELQRLQLRYGAKIERLKDDHDRLYELMKQAHDEAARCYHMGQHDTIPYWKEKAAEYRSMMPAVVEERRALISELESARANHRALRDEYRPLKEEFGRARDSFRKRLDELKAENEYQRKKRIWQ
jgi:hypothetical protein